MSAADPDAKPKATNTSSLTFSECCPEINPNQRKLLLRELLAKLPKKKTLETDTVDYDIDFEETEKFCVECGQMEFEGQISCKCTGFNSALTEVEQMLQEYIGGTGE